MRRNKIPKRASKRDFTRKAGNKNVHPRNATTQNPMRGGIRL